MPVASSTAISSVNGAKHAMPVKAQRPVGGRAGQFPLPVSQMGVGGFPFGGLRSWSSAWWSSSPCTFRPKVTLVYGGRLLVIGKVAGVATRNDCGNVVSQSGDGYRVSAVVVPSPAVLWKMPTG